MVRLSQRLLATAEMVGTADVLADVGTDHGYVPIYLRQQGCISRAIAMDIRKGPLQRAAEHIAQYRMQEYIETRLSDGVAALAPNEADVILAAGMGGGLIVHILEDGQEICRGANGLILQPQSELYRVRSYLAGHGYVTEAEDMVAEDGKFYPIMRVRWTGMPAFAGDAAEEKEAPERDAALLYGAMLLGMRHPVLKRYLAWERGILAGVERELTAQAATPQIEERRWEIAYRLACNEAGMAFFDA